MSNIDFTALEAKHHQLLEELETTKRLLEEEKKKTEVARDDLQASQQVAARVTKAEQEALDLRVQLAAERAQLQSERVQALLDLDERERQHQQQLDILKKTRATAPTSLSHSEAIRQLGAARRALDAKEGIINELQAKYTQLKEEQDLINSTINLLERDDAPQAPAQSAQPSPTLSTPFPIDFNFGATATAHPTFSFGPATAPVLAPVPDPAPASLADEMSDNMDLTSDTFTATPKPAASPDLLPAEQQQQQQTDDGTSASILDNYDFTFPPTDQQQPDFRVNRWDPQYEGNVQLMEETGGIPDYLLDQFSLPAGPELMPDFTAEDMEQFAAGPFDSIDTNLYDAALMDRTFGLTEDQRRQAEQLQAQTEQVQIQAKHFHARSQQLEAEIEANAEHIQALSDKIETQASELRRQESQIKIQADKIEAQTFEIGRLSIGQAADSDTQKLEDEVAALRKTVEEQAAKLKKQTDKIAVMQELENKNVALCKKAEEQAAELEKRTDKIAATQELEDKNVALCKTVEEQAERLEKQADNIAALRKTVKEQAAGIEEEADKNTVLYKIIEEQAAKLEKQTDKIAAMRKAVEEQAARIDKQADKVDEQADRIEKQASIIDQRPEINTQELKKENDAQRETIREQATKLEKMKEKLTANSNEIKRFIMTQGLDASTISMQELEEEIAAQRQTIAHQTEQIQVLSSTAEENDSQRQTIEQQAEKIQRLMSTIEKDTAHRQNLEQQVEEIQAQTTIRTLSVVSGPTISTEPTTTTTPPGPELVAVAVPDLRSRLFYWLLALFAFMLLALFWFAGHLDVERRLWLEANDGARLAALGQRPVDSGGTLRLSTFVARTLYGPEDFFDEELDWEHWFLCRLYKQVLAGPGVFWASIFSFH